MGLHRAASYPLHIPPSGERRAFLDNEIEEQLQLLEERADKTLRLERSLTLFSKRYYSELGDAFETLALLRQQIKLARQMLPERLSQRYRLPKPSVGSAYAPVRLAAQDQLATGSAEQVTSVQTQLRSLYRGLAKQLHPDTMRPEEYRAHHRHMCAANEAYAKKEMAALWCLIFALEDEQNAPSIETLHQRIAVLKRQNYDLKERHHQLKHSEEMALIRKHGRLKRIGKSLFTEVARHLASDVARANRMLAALNIELLASTRRSIARTH